MYAYLAFCQINADSKTSLRVHRRYPPLGRFVRFYGKGEGSGSFIGDANRRSDSDSRPARAARGADPSRQSSDRRNG